MNINGKWVKACQTVIPSSSEPLKITIPPVKVATKKGATFFSPQSFYEGVVNNGAGVVGFINVGLKADDEFAARMKREADLAAKLEARKKKGRET